MSKVNLMNFDYEMLKQFFAEHGQKPFRAQQVMKWIYQEGVDDFQKMTNISKDLRAFLDEHCIIQAPTISEEQVSRDGTIKWAMQVGEQQIETVFIPEDDRGTLCVSSQVGCALACTFCSTAQQGFNKNLTVSEIIGQV